MISWICFKIIHTKNKEEMRKDWENAWIFFFFLAAPQSLQDLNSLTRD